MTKLYNEREIKMSIFAPQLVRQRIIKWPLALNTSSELYGKPGFLSFFMLLFFARPTFLIFKQLAYCSVKTLLATEYKQIFQDKEQTIQSQILQLSFFYFMSKKDEHKKVFLLLTRKEKVLRGFVSFLIYLLLHTCTVVRSNGLCITLL